MSNTLYFSTSGFNFKINNRTDIPLNISDSFWKEYIPDFSVKGIEESVEINITLGDIKYPQIKVNDNIDILLPLNLNYSDKDLITLIDYGIEPFRNSKETYCFHGNYVSKDGMGIAIIGGVSGLGKTSLAINLSNKDGYKLLADEKFLLTKLGVYAGGVSVMRFNKETLKDFNDESYDGKSLFIPVSEVKTKVFIQPIITDQQIHIEEWSNTKANFHLYEELTRKTRGVSRLISNFTLPVHSLDTDELANKRQKFCRELSTNLRFYTVRGNPDAIFKFIENNINT